MSNSSLSDGCVVLRPLRLGDADDVTRCCQDADSQRFTHVPVPYTRDDAVAWLTAHKPSESHRATNPTWAITMPGVTADRWGGSINLELNPGEPAVVGYMVAPWLRGRGAATRALRLACRWGFDHAGLTAIQWSAHLGNDASRRVAENAGFRIDPEPRRGLLVRGVETDYWSGRVIEAELTDNTSASGRRGVAGG